MKGNVDGVVARSVSKYSNRWFNTYHYYRLYPENSPTNIGLNSDQNYEDIDITPAVQNTITNPYQDDAECSQDVTDVGTEIVRIGVSQQITYHDMVKKLSELARTVQFKQEDCITVMADISKMIDQYRSKCPFVMNLTTFDECTKSNESITLVNATNDAILVSTSIPPVFTKRKMSLLE